MDLAACRHRLRIDASSSRIVALVNLTSSVNAIPRSSYLFGASWPQVRRTLVVAVEQSDDPFAVMVPTAELIRFYYAPSTRLAQALFWLFWGDYKVCFRGNDITGEKPKNQQHPDPTFYFGSSRRTSM
jgi:hypothetical protein